MVSFDSMTKITSYQGVIEFKGTFYFFRYVEATRLKIRNTGETTT